MSAGEDEVAAREPALSNDVLTRRFGKPRGGAGLYLWTSVVEALLHAGVHAPDRTQACLLQGRAHRGVVQQQWVEVLGYAELGSVSDTRTYGAELLQDWELTNNRLSRGKTPLQVVGWCVLRAGGDAAPTESDRFVHRSLFNQPWHVLVLVDTLSERLGVWGHDPVGRLVPVGFQLASRRS